MWLGQRSGKSDDQIGRRKPWVARELHGNEYLAQFLKVPPCERLEIPIGDRTQKWHSGIHCLNARPSSAKSIGAAAGQEIPSDGFSEFRGN